MKKVTTCLTSLENKKMHHRHFAKSIEKQSPESMYLHCNESHTRPGRPNDMKDIDKYNDLGVNK
jgi:hypothetical protein